MKAFLAALAETAIVRDACEAAGVESPRVYEYRKESQAFAEAWEKAKDAAADLLEREAVRRAREGWEEPVFGSGGTGVGTVEVGRIRKYSDTLLIFLLKGARPDKYRERRELVGSGGGPLQIEYVNDWRGPESS